MNVASQQLGFTSEGRTISVDHFTGSTGTAPAVVLLHGADGLNTGHHYRLAAQVVASAGYHAFLLHYLDRTGQSRAAYSSIGANFPAWMQTVRDAVGFAERQAGVDPDRIGLIGTSLGGGLALAVAADEPRVRALVSYFGFLPATLRGGVARFPPTLVLHGARDAIVPVSNAREIESFLQGQGVAHEVHVYPDQAHGFSGLAQLDAAQRTATFLARHLLARAPEPRAAQRG